MGEVLPRLDQEWKEEQEALGERTRKQTETSVGTIETIEILNLIDERLLEDMDPRELSRLKSEAEKRQTKDSKVRASSRTAEIRHLKNLIPKRYNDLF